MKNLQFVLAALAAFVGVLSWSSDAHADIRIVGDREPNSAFELRLGPYVPAIDNEFGDDGAYEKYFGSKTPLMLELEYDRQFWRGVGSLGASFSAGMSSVKGTSRTVDDESSTDRTRLRLVPLRIGAVYRFDYLQTRFNVPLVLAAKFGFDYYLWFASSTGGISDAPSDGGVRKGSGGTAGFHGAIALHFLLDFLAPNMASGFQANVGVDNTYLFAELMVARVNDFGSKSSWNLSDTTAMFGMAFEF